MNKYEFVDVIKNSAKIGWTEYQILPRLIIAQAILESNWGESELSQRANNLFGIKATADWKGKIINMPTVESLENEMKIVNADFRAYDTFDESILGHSKILTFQRYAAVSKCADYKTACKNIWISGYATDHDYHEKRIELIEENKLHEFDSDIVENKGLSRTKEDNVLKFQHLCNVLGIRDSEYKVLVEDNILGFRTRSCISKMPLLMIGSHGPAVEFVQEILKTVIIDGDYGNITRCFVMEYQKEKNLTVDGTVGKETWNALITT